MEMQERITECYNIPENDKEVGGTTSTARKAVDDAIYKAGVREAIKIYTPYVKALVEENSGLVGLASSHGWSSSGVELGKQCRKKIKELKASSKPN